VYFLDGYIRIGQSRKFWVAFPRKQGLDGSKSKYAKEGTKQVVTDNTQNEY
jgi:hypothetical protein